MSREHSFDILLPSTKQLLLRLHNNSYDCYMAAANTMTNELAMLEEVCIMYEYSFQFEDSGYHGLRLLGIPINHNRMDISLQLLEELVKAIDSYNDKKK